MRRAQARQSYIFRYVVILLRVYWRKVTRARRTASADWWITPGTAGMRPRDLFTTSRDYRESVGIHYFSYEIGAVTDTNRQTGAPAIPVVLSVGLFQHRGSFGVTATAVRGYSSIKSQWSDINCRYESFEYPLKHFVAGVVELLREFAERAAGTFTTLWELGENERRSMSRKRCRGVHILDISPPWCEYSDESASIVSCLDGRCRNNNLEASQIERHALCEGDIKQLTIKAFPCRCSARPFDPPSNPPPAPLTPPPLSPAGRRYRHNKYFTLL
ncbi:hypothetical protein EVAR_8674_1 [Eumeta japonica]|uniref:Uncharacterized protein n=1 Tax=Eumeta variegata TaxID=151549 RepID=A0A4C1TUJ0_EUMVA|nr:hypothetical protein EVAR_8674_1 [Eumeta japonica]